jgi:hypothetical protein
MQKLVVRTLHLYTERNAVRGAYPRSSKEDGCKNFGEFLTFEVLVSILCQSLLRTLCCPVLQSLTIWPSATSRTWSRISFAIVAIKILLRNTVEYPSI